MIIKSEYYEIDKAAGEKAERQIKMRFKIKKDKNGNRVLFVKPAVGRGFSIQTNGNLPMCHSELCFGRWYTCESSFFNTIWAEAGDYITRHGTTAQKKAVGYMTENW